MPTAPSVGRFVEARLREIQYVAGELRIFQKCAIIQKSEIFAQSALKLGQNELLIVCLFCPSFIMIGENCGFFNNSTFLENSQFSIYLIE